MQNQTLPSKEDKDAIPSWIAGIQRPRRAGKLRDILADWMSAALSFACNLLIRFDEMNEEYEYGYEEEDDDIEYYAERPNKTQIKKEMAALFDLGQELSQLSLSQLHTFELPEIVRNSVIQVSGMPHKGARKRLLKYIAGQLHKMDIEPIQENMARIKNTSAHAVREHHMAERWRDDLIDRDNEALTELLDELPHADIQHLRQLIRNSKKEIEASKPPKSARMLYRYLKELLGGNAPENEGPEGEETDKEEN